MSTSTLPCLRHLSELALLSVDTKTHTASADATADYLEYTWGVVLPGSNIAYQSGGIGPAPSRVELRRLFDEKMGNDCNPGFARQSIESALLHVDEEGLFYVLNAKGEFVGGATVEDSAFPWEPVKWMGDLHTLAAMDVYSGKAAGSPLERYRKAKAKGLTFPLNEVCTHGADPGLWMERLGKDARVPNRPRGAGKALVRGIRAFVEQSYVQPMAQHFQWEPDFIRAWCFLEADVVDTALWFWKGKLRFVDDPEVVPIDEGVFPMYRPLFSHEGADHVPLEAAAAAADMLPLLSLQPLVPTGASLPTNQLKLHFEFTAPGSVTLKITTTIGDASERMQGRIDALVALTLKPFGQNGANTAWKMTHAQFSSAVRALTCNKLNEAGRWSKKPKPPTSTIQAFQQFLVDTDGSQHVDIVWAIEP